MENPRIISRRGTAVILQRRLMGGSDSPAGDVGDGWREAAAGIGGEENVIGCPVIDRQSARRALQNFAARQLRVGGKPSGCGGRFDWRMRCGTGYETKRGGVAQGAEERGTGSDLEEPLPALHGLIMVGPFAAIGLDDAVGRGRAPPECAPENFLAATRQRAIDATAELVASCGKIDCWPHS